MKEEAFFFFLIDARGDFVGAQAITTTEDDSATHRGQDTAELLQRLLTRTTALRLLLFCSQWEATGVEHSLLIRRDV